MASRVEQCISRSLRTILANLPDGFQIGDSKDLREMLSGLEYFLPGILGQIYPEWNQESLDGILPVVARKTREGEAEILGLAIIMSDQTLTPVHLRLQVSSRADEVCWLECRLGEQGPHGMVRYNSESAASKRLYVLDLKADAIDWMYRVTFGDRSP